jgi:hypothetical protein
VGSGTSLTLFEESLTADRRVGQSGYQIDLLEIGTQSKIVYAQTKVMILFIDQFMKESFIETKSESNGRHDLGMQLVARLIPGINQAALVPLGVVKYLPGKSPKMSV